MKKVVLLVAFLAFCVPIYGDTAVLVYKITMSGTPTIFDANLSTETANTESAAMVRNSVIRNGYLVLDVNTTTLQTSRASEPNFMPKLILHGKDPNTLAKRKWKLSGSDVHIHKMVTLGAKPRTCAFLAYDVNGVADANVFAATPGHKKLGLFGRLVPTVLVRGSKEKVEVPMMLTGVGDFGNIIDDNDIPFYGEGAVTATLDVATTLVANKESQNVKDVADLIYSLW